MGERVLHHVDPLDAALDRREEHDDLHPSEVLRRELSRRYQERSFEWRPYLYRWLGGPATEPLEQALIAARAIRPLGFRWVGVSRSLGH